MYGMNTKVGMVSFPPKENEFSKPYSPATAQLIDEEVRELVAGAYQRTVELMKTHKVGLHRSRA